MRQRNPISERIEDDDDNENGDTDEDLSSSVSSLSDGSVPEDLVVRKAFQRRRRRRIPTAHSLVITAASLVILFLLGLGKMTGKYMQKLRIRRDQHLSRLAGSQLRKKDILLPVYRKDPIAQTLREASVQGLTGKIPLWETVTTIYGEEPVVIGMETCHNYRQTVPPHKRYVAPGGLFNTGTNTLDAHLSLNLRGVRSLWQLPWGKHWLPKDAKYKRQASDMESEDHDCVLPVIVVRDPLFWLQSMCQTPYSVYWMSQGSQRCQSFPKNNDAKRVMSSPIQMRMETGYAPQFETLIHLWNEYYGQFWNAPYPRLIVRYEDLLWHAPRVLSMVSDCVGADTSSKMRSYSYVTSPAKTHGNKVSNLIDAIARAGSEEMRKTGYLTAVDLQEVTKTIDHTLVHLFQYSL